MEDPQNRIHELEFALEKISDLKNPEGATKEMLLKLRAPTEEHEIEWRVQASGEGNDNDGVWARIVPYIDARAVTERLDKSVGPTRWQDAYTPIEKGFLCTLMIHTQNGWISKQDAADFTDIEPIKGGISDSIKRAAVKWGIGRDLYSYGISYAETSLTKQKGWNQAKTKSGKEFWWRPEQQKQKTAIGAKS